MTIRAGLLMRLCIFERRTDTRNEFNELVGLWVEIGRIRGQLLALNAREYFEALQAQSERSYRLICRWTPKLAAVVPSDRVQIDGVVHDIQSGSDPTGRRRELEFVVIQHDETSQ